MSLAGGEGQFEAHGSGVEEKILSIDNILYPKEDKDQQILLYACSNCGHQVLRYTSENVFVPLTVGGGIRDFTDANGRRSPPLPFSENNLLIFLNKVNGGLSGPPIGAYELAKAVEELGVGEILLNCIDCDDESNSSSFSKPNCPFSQMVILILSQRFKYAEGILLSARVSVWIGLWTSSQGY
ncbi:Imidazole glycerol phosphate synthase hisHF, chloroplastic [Morella rubra]|uniref:Imidazole glycerol phosphate synthase hisHF, chloroplastic n=1 Tax=Morella rubra TaxID=262757 RepID=A0A6A1V6D9_9ROSI|nr:Imidazole glycerol phosphate synthase hisHF, chloroplastic [Morella rubra]